MLHTIYKIFSDNAEDGVYIGITTRYSKSYVISSYRNRMKDSNNLVKNKSISAEILDTIDDTANIFRGDVPKIYIAARKRDYIMLQRKSLNVQLPYKTFEDLQSIASNKVESVRVYQQTHKDTVYKKNAEWAAANKDTINEAARARYARDSSLKLQSNSEYAQKNKDAINARRRAHRKAQKALA